MTRVLLVTGDDDYHAISFESKNSGKSVTDIMDNISEYENDDMYDISIYEFESIDPKFFEFVRRNIQDYDMSKTTNFYVEGEIVR